MVYNIRKRWVKSLSSCNRRKRNTGFTRRTSRWFTWRGRERSQPYPVISPRTSLTITTQRRNPALTSRFHSLYPPNDFTTSLSPQSLKLAPENSHFSCCPSWNSSPSILPTKRSFIFKAVLLILLSCVSVDCWVPIWKTTSKSVKESRVFVSKNQISNEFLPKYT